jgi:hypothetical protein
MTNTYNEGDIVRAKEEVKGYSHTMPKGAVGIITNVAFTWFCVDFGTADERIYVCPDFGEANSEFDQQFETLEHSVDHFPFSYWCKHHREWQEEEIEDGEE